MSNATLRGERRKEHEAHHVCAGLERSVERALGLQAADFDKKRHLSHPTGGRSLTRGAVRSSGAGRFVLPSVRLRPSTSARRCGRRGRAWRAVRRHLLWRSQAASPPTTTPTIRTRRMTANNGSVAAKAGLWRC